MTINKIRRWVGNCLKPKLPPVAAKEPSMTTDEWDSRFLREQAALAAHEAALQGRIKVLEAMATRTDAEEKTLSDLTAQIHALQETLGDMETDMVGC